jgi:predicted DNA-binding transcriptional regulator YafY
MNPSRIRRLIQLLGLLQAGQDHNVDRLATICNVSRRTIFRDLEMSRNAGVPLLFDKPAKLRNLIADHAGRLVEMYNGDAGSAALVPVAARLAV